MAGGTLIKLKKTLRQVTRDTSKNNFTISSDSALSYRESVRAAIKKNIGLCPMTSRGIFIAFSVKKSIFQLIIPGNAGYM